MLICLLWLLSQTVSTFVFELCCSILWLRFFYIRPHFWIYSTILHSVHKLPTASTGMHCWFLQLEQGAIVQILQLWRKIGSTCALNAFIFVSGVVFFNIEYDFQLVNRWNYENLSSLYVFTRLQHVSEIFAQSPFVVGSVYIMHCSILS